MKTLSHIMNTRYLCLLFSLLLVLNIAGLAAAQSSPADRELFDFPDTVDLFFAYHVGSDQAIVVVPAEGVSIMVVDTIPFAQIDQSALDPSNWQTVDSVDLWPGETLVLRSSAGILYKLTCRLVSGRDIPRIQVTYAPVPPVLPDPTPPASGELAFYDALDLDTGDTFTDPTVASVILCDAGPPPTPTPGPGVIPEPGTGILLLLGLLGLLGSWLLARRGKPTPVPSQEGNCTACVPACEPNKKKWWLFLLLLSIALLSVSGADYLIAQQSCTLTVEKQGTGRGHVIGRGIDCGPDCTVSPSEFPSWEGQGWVVNLKAIPDDGSVFVEWLVDGFSPYQGIFRMSGDTTLTAVFEEIPNEAPLAEDDAYSTEEDTELQISAPGVLDNDSDPDGDPISAILMSGPSHGSLTLNLDGSLTYSPESDFHGTDQFTYRATDGDLESADATVTITVNSVNEPPIAVNDAYSTAEDVELQILAPGVLTNDSDPDGDPVNAAIVNDPSHGSLTLNPDGSCVYLPDADFHGIDQFIYRATDGELDSAVAAVTITVNGVSDAPLADDLMVETVKNRPVDIFLHGHDGDDDPLTYQIVEAPTHGTLSGTDNHFTYTPETDFLGQDSFTYLVNDGTSDSTIATVTIDVRDIDLAISDVDMSQTSFDPQSMSLTGTVTVTFENAGAEDITDPYEVQVYVEDKKTATITELGTATMSTPLASGETGNVEVSVEGVILFKDQPVYAFVDSLDVIMETNEENNLLSSNVNCEMIPPIKVAYWKFDENAGGIVSDSFEDNDGTIHGASWTDGLVKSALYFDGDDYLSIPDNPNLRLPIDAVTIEAWINVERSQFGHILAKQYDGLGLPYQYQYDSYVLWIYGTAVWFSVSDGSSHQPRISYTISLNEWHHVVGTWDQASSTMSLYIDGEFRVNGYFPELGSIIYDDSPCLIGADNNNSDEIPDDRFYGVLDEVALYDRVLTPEEIQQHYEDGLKGLGYPIELPPTMCEDYSASYLRVDTADFPNSATIIARIGNAGIVDLAVPLDVAFYHGDPQAGGTLLGTTTLDSDLPSGSYEDVSLTWNTPTVGLHDVYVVVDDDGTGQDKIRESNEDNNTTSTTIEIREYDLEVTQVDVSQAVFDPDTMQLSGPTSVTIHNNGASAVEQDFTLTVYVEDKQQGTRTVLGGSLISTSVLAGETQVIDLAIEGSILFKDQLVYAFVDSEDVIAEVDEANNIAHTMAECEAPISSPAIYDYILNVGAKSNIFGAGHAVPTSPGGGSGGQLPPYIDLPAGVGRVLTFSTVTGIVDCCSGLNPNGPDGHGYPHSTNINSFEGIAGIIHNDRQMFLAGVFLDDFEPLDPAPPRLDFTGTDNFTELSPLLHQTFYIGDGLTGTDSGSVQQFHVPDGASRLYLGFADGWAFHGGYADNVGALMAEFMISVPLFCDDYTASYIRVETAGYPNSANITIRVGNSGVLSSPDILDVAFYDGDPQTGGTLLGTVQTQDILEPGHYEDITFTWNNCPEGLNMVYVVVDDDGTGIGKVRESSEDNNTARATFPFIGQLPVADAGDDQHMLPGNTVTLDGSGSYDPNGYEPLTYYWSMIDAPDKSWVVLNNPTSVTPNFVPDLSGTYVVQLTVTNSLGVSSDPDQVTVIMGTPNDPPLVFITSPADGAMYMPGGAVLIRTDAEDPDGTIMKVEFYADATLLGEDMEAPYEYFWTNIPDGSYRITAIASDDGGASTESAPVNIGVGIPANRPPEITSNPPVTVEHETTFSYDVEASDPDHDPLTFSLTEAPTGMTIDSTTGLITWTPTVDQVGAHPVTVIVEDGKGAGASQSFTIHVTQPQSGNQFAPSITSIPSHVVILGETYSYDVEATDGDGDPLTYSLSMAPSGMTIDASTGLITWTPTEAQLGMHDVTVLVDDGRGGIGGQYFNIQVQEPNQPPTVSIGYPTNNQQVRVGDTVTIQAQAADADGSVTRVEFYLGTTLLGENTTAPYEIDWTPTETDLGQQTLTATAYDNENASTTSDPITVEVLEALPDTEPPIIEITVNPEHIVLGDDVNIQITILDDSPITDITLDIDGTPVPIVNNQATYTSQSTGFHTVTVTATDSAGNTGTGSETFGVYSGTDTTPPEVDLDDEVEFECVELAADLYDIVGSISDDNKVHYKLLSREKGVSVWDTLIEGTTTSPLSGVLTTFDPTIYRNGIHEIRLWAEDTAGNEASVDGCLLLDGRLKVGQATIGGIDFNIPQLGYPLLVGRVYDSRDREGGGFGNGWSMPHEASNVQADFTYDPAQNWGEEVRGGWMKTYYLISRDRKLVVLRLGDGGVFKFKMDVSPKSSFLYPILNNASFPMTVSYIPVEDTTGTLEALNVDPEVYLFSGGVLASWDGEAYNPTRFRLTLEDGTVYVFDKYVGLLSITDPYGHAISYSDDAITHSSGASLSIERDTSNRIEYIRDQLGRTVEYQYDEDGMLVKVIQHGEGPYPMRVLEAMGYQQGIFERPVLKDIIAPDGTRLGSFEYDSSGRKTALIDHNGNRVLFGYNAPSHEYTVTDRRGNPTTYIYDSDGNVTSITDAEGSTESYTYDADGNVLAKTNKLGYTNSFTYDADGNVLSETDPLGNTMTYTYDSQGNRLTETDPLGNTTEYTYDAYGNLLTAEDALNHLTTFVYDADGLMQSTTDALNNTTTYDYDGQGNMTTKTDPLGNSVEFTYDLYGNVVTSTDEMGHVTHKEYDPQGNNVRIIDALGHETTMDYHHTGKVTAYTDPAGKVTNNVFDPNGNLLSNTDPAGSTFNFEYDENEQPTITTSTITTENGVETVTIEKVYDTLNRVTEQIDADGLFTQAEYDALGRQTATIDKLGNRSEIQYDPRNFPTRSVGPDGSEEINTYDAAGRVTSKTDALGRITQHEYDAVGNVKKVLNPNGTWVENDYDALGRMVGTVSSTGLTTSRTYDEAGRLIEETDALGRTTTYEYYPDGKRKKMIDPRGNAFTFDYDERGRQTAMHFPDGTSVTYDYNKQGKKIEETDQLNHTTRFEWNDLGLLQKITDPLLHETSYEYNEIGNLIAQTDANQHTTTFAYNKLGRRIGKTYPLGMSQSISYDVENRTTSVTDFNGETTVSEYDQLGRLIKTDFPDGSSMTYTYTASGQIETVTDHRGTTRYEYDNEARLERRLDPDGTEISYTYDTLGRRTSVTVPSGTTSYTYDAYGRLDTVTDPDGVSVTRYTYDTHGNKASVIYPNGLITEYGYDNLNRLISVETRTLMSDIMASYTYTLNAKGQRTHVEERIGTQLVRTIDYIYDAANRLTEEKIDDVVTGVRTISYTYDPVGNRLTKDDNGVLTTYDYDDNDRLLTEGGFSYGYDNNGNMLSKTGNGEQYDFTYNALNQPVHADIDTGGSSSTVDYVYDHDGIRVGKTINGTDVIKYVVDKNRPYAQVLEEQWTNGALSATTGYVYGENLISRTTNGAPHFYHYDGMGSTRTLTDMSGTVTDAYQYDAYGNLLDKTGSTINPYLYRSEQYDDDLSSYYLRARYYQPGIGRFMTVDPVEGFPNSPITLHRYVYGNDNPTSYMDPSGNLTLNESLVVAAEISFLSMLTLSAVESSGVASPYSFLAKHVLPDAFIVGFNIAGTLPGPFACSVYLILKLLDLYDVLEPVPPFLQVSGGFGGELLLSVSSGERALFFTAHYGAAVAMIPTASLGIELYDGFVFNLWNAEDYSGPFESLTLNLGFEKIKGGWSLFWDSNRCFTGPWGGASPFLSKSFSLDKSYVSMAKSLTYYKMIGTPERFISRHEVVDAIVAAIFVTKLIQTLDNLPNFRPTPFAFWLLETSMWIHTGLAHHYWANKEPLYNMDRRRTTSRDKVPEFHSGPPIWRLPL